MSHLINDFGKLLQSGVHDLIVPPQWESLKELPQLVSRTVRSLESPDHSCLKEGGNERNVIPHQRKTEHSYKICG